MTKRIRITLMGRTGDGPWGVLNEETCLEDKAFMELLRLKIVGERWQMSGCFPNLQTKLDIKELS